MKSMKLMAMVALLVGIAVPASAHDGGGKGGKHGKGASERSSIQRDDRDGVFERRDDRDSDSDSDSDDRDRDGVFGRRDDRTRDVNSSRGVTYSQTRARLQRQHEQWHRAHADKRQNKNWERQHAKLHERLRREDLKARDRDGVTSTGGVWSSTRLPDGTARDTRRSGTWQDRVRDAVRTRN
jgi:hypothetical protein